MSQDILGKKLGIKQNTVSMYENGESFPDPATIERIIEILDISRNQLFDNIKYGDIEKGGNPALQEPDPVPYGNPHKNILTYLDQLEEQGELSLETSAKLKTYVLKMYEEILTQHKKYDALRELVKKELNLPI